MRSIGNYFPLESINVRQTGGISVEMAFYGIACFCINWFTMSAHFQQQACIYLFGVYFKCMRKDIIHAYNLNRFLKKTFSKKASIDLGCTCCSHWFIDFDSSFTDQAANLHLMVKKLPLTPTLFQQGGRDSPFCKLTPSGDCGLAISSPPPCTPLLGDTHKAGNRSCEDGHGFMMRGQVRLNKAYSHLGWEPPPYLEIYDEDDTADYSRLLKRIGHGPASALFSVCVCISAKIGQMEAQ